MAAPNLTNYANVKAWLALATDNDQQMIVRLIGEASGMILRYLQRPGFSKASYSDVYDGCGTPRLFIDKWPVLSVSSLVVDGNTIPALQAPQTGCGYGYILQTWNGAPPGQPQSLTLRGGKFCYGQSNVAVNYVAGYSIANEACKVPAAPCQVTVQQPSGAWAQDDGVTYANGNALTAVTGTPSAGQYNAPSAAAPGIYTFASADIGQNMLISYSYTPFDIEQACIELVGERYRYKARIGEKSHSISGQVTVSFDNSGIPDIVKNLLLPYQSKLLF